MRKLASIQKIKSVEPIKGADKVELVKLLGWQVVAKKDEFKVGDLVVYCEMDSVLPDRPEFGFLGPKKRIRAINLRKTRSEGIVFPIEEVLPTLKHPKEGQDVTKELGVTKYINPTELRDMERNTREMKRTKFGRLILFVRKFKWGRKLFPKKPHTNTSFPSWIAKTDEVRVQNIPEVLESGNTYLMHEKVDGSSLTAGIRYNNKGELETVLCSRNRNIEKGSTSVNDRNFVKVFEMYGMENVLLELISFFGAQRVVIQGELLGPKVQNNIYKFKEHEFRLFNLVVDGKLIDYENESEILDEILAPLPKVPYLGTITLDYYTVDTILDKATYKSKLNKSTDAEGIVFRAYGDVPIKSFKAVSPKYLLKKQKLEDAEEDEERNSETE